MLRAHRFRPGLGEEYELVERVTDAGTLSAALLAIEDEDDALTEEALISMFKDTFDAQEVEDNPR